MDDYFFDAQWTFNFIQRDPSHKPRLERALRLSVGKAFNYIYISETKKIALLITDEDFLEDECEEL